MTSAPTDFYPRPPRGGRRLYRHSQADVVNFYPRPPQGGRPLQFPLVRTDDVISIHALREEGDRQPLRGGTPPQRFLSTPSARRATVDTITKAIAWKFLSTPSARRATYTLRHLPQVREISIHALREEGDGRLSAALRPPAGFLSTPSARRATGAPLSGEPFLKISIHALREEGDTLF